MSLAKYTESIAKRKTGNQDGWKAFKWQVLDPDVYKVTGGIPKITAKGKESWRGIEGESAYVHRSEVEAEKAAYVQATGNCPECFGDGKELSGYSVKTGTTYRDCHHCKGTGKS